jgi:hypothetical protein
MSIAHELVEKNDRSVRKVDRRKKEVGFKDLILPNS